MPDAASLLFRTLLTAALVLFGRPPGAGAQAGSAAPPRPDGQKAEPVLTRTFIVGTSPRIQELMKENPRGHQFRRELNQVRVDERPVPKSCGVPLASYFRREVASRFRVAATNACSISPDRVDCASGYLPGNSQLYLSLSYLRRPTELDLNLAVLQQGFFGSKKADVPETHVDWFEDVFDCLINISECGSELPLCARRVSPGG